MKRILALLIGVCLLLCGCGAKAGSDDTAATPDSASVQSVTEATEPPTEAPTEPPSDAYLGRARFSTILTSALTAKKASIAVEEIYQYPELPTGCESVALTMALNSMGYQLKKTDIASDYLIYGNYVDGFLGNPFSSGGAGILSLGLVRTVNKFVNETGAKVYARDTTGKSMTDLYKFISKGCPVVIWTTYYMNSPVFDGGVTYNGEFYRWYNNEHCVMLCGYDLNDKTVTIADPLRGVVTVDAARFEEINTSIGGYSMVLIDTSDPT